MTKCRNIKNTRYDNLENPRKAKS